ncbi:MAG: MFS transporter [Desulfobacterales bacterium]
MTLRGKNPLSMAGFSNPTPQGFEMLYFRISRQFIGIGSFQVLAMFRRGLFYAYLSIYLRYFLGLSATETTLFATLPMLLNICFQTLVWGRLSDRRQLRRTLIVRGEVLGAAGTLIVWYLHTLPASRAAAGWVIILGLAAVEIFWSMSNIGWSALISDVYPARERNAVQGRLASLGGLGRIAGVWIGGLLYDGMATRYEGWGFHEGTLFFVAAGVMLLSTIPLRWVPEGGIRDAETTRSGPVGPEDGSSRLFFIFLVAMMFINFGRNSIVIIQSQYLFLESGFHLDSRMLSYVYNTESGAIILWGLLVGWLGNRLGNGKTVCVGAMIALAFLGIYATADHLPLVFLGSFLKGSAEVILMASAYAFASVLIPADQRGRRFSWFNATFFLSWGLAGTLMAGPLIDLMLSAGAAPVNAYRAAFVAAAMMTAAGLGLQVWLLFQRKGLRRRKEAEIG